MTPRTRALIDFVIILLGMIFITLGTAALLSLHGDCAPEVRNCGETSRKISLLVLADGAIAVCYYVYRFFQFQWPR